MAQINVLDRYYLAITFLVTLAYQMIGFVTAYTLQFDKLTDFMGGSNFVILAILSLVYIIQVIDFIVRFCLIIRSFSVWSQSSGEDFIPSKEIGHISSDWRQLVC